MKYQIICFKICCSLKNSANNALKLSKELVDVYKMDLNKFEICKEPILLSTFLKRYEEDVERIQLDYDGIINMDECRIDQVLRNLIANARDFVDKNFGEIILRTELIENVGDGKYIKFGIQDNGIGIPKEKRSFLFKEFGTNIHPNIKRTHPRSGLGLYICKGIVEAHGGEIWVEDNDKKGTTFSFKFPV